MKYDLTDVTFMVSIKIDSIIRLENVLLSIRFLRKHFKCQIMVLEVDRHNNGILQRMLDGKVEYHFRKDCDTVFYRTKYQNEMAQMVVTPYLCIWDADIIIAPTQIMAVMDKLRNEECEFGIPYDGSTYGVPTSIKELFAVKQQIGLLHEQRGKMHLRHGIPHSSCGGATFANVDIYKKAGMENLAFYGWGAEDDERTERWRIMGYRIYWADGVLYHLSHPRGMNSGYTRDGQLANAKMVAFATETSSVEELRSYFDLQNNKNLNIDI
ncbi:MAG: hypothetical protein LBN24_02345 [Mediterranea sp.]|jgi:hypothetical protein|nr:hypothetical protein [Mediterranea sp.]